MDRSRFCLNPKNSHNVQAESTTVNVKQYILWIIPLFLLVVSCLTPLFVNSYFAGLSEKNESDEIESDIDDENKTENVVNFKTNLDVTVYKHFGYELKKHSELNWLKIVFFVGFGISHFTIGFIGDHFGKWKVFDYLIKILIIFEMISITTRNIYEFTICWFVIAYCSMASYLLVVCTVLQSTDQVFNHFKFRFAAGVLFQMAWTTSQLYCKLIVYLCSDWRTVMLVLDITIVITYFLFKSHIWQSPLVKQSEEEIHSKDTLLKDMKSTYVNIKLNLLILSLTWFTLGYNTYGLQSSWRHVALYGQIFAHDLLGSIMEFFSKFLALIVCFAVKQKRLPLSVLQLLFALTYFCSMSFDKDDFINNQKTVKSALVVFLVHISDFFDSSSFSLMWIITPESFPENYRTGFVGLCSGVARIGAITGIILGDYDLFHLFAPVLILAGTLALFSSLLVPFLPDMTQHKMPKTFQDIQDVQFSKRLNSNPVPISNGTSTNSVII